MSEWIAVVERLPPPGKRVIFSWNNALGNRRASIGIYAAKMSIEIPGEWDTDFADYSEEKDEYYRPEGWWEEGCEIEECAFIRGVTHWMPMPAYPVAAEIGKQQ